MIETDRLLELIDQFAATEGRMKWAPNKKLHFEVAVIKAIQTLSQVTLTEVIENLTALRGGGETPARSAPPQTQRSSSKLVPEKKSAAASVAGIVDPGVPSVSSAQSPHESGSRVDSTESDMTVVWSKVVQLASTRRPLIKTWIDSATLLGTEGRQVRLGFPPDQKTVMESILRPSNLSFLEALFKELTGTDWKLKLSLVEGLPAAEPRSEPPSQPDRPASKPDEGFDSFKDDPLIRAALEIFKGEIKSVTT